MSILKFILFYNGQEKYDNYVILYDETSNEWSLEHTKFDTGVFGNFWPQKKGGKNMNLKLKTKVYGKEYTFPSSENAFQASKCKNKEDIEQFAKISALQSFRVGRSVDLRDDWDSIKIKIMKKICMDKFTQFDELKKILLETNDTYLIEHTPVKNRDKYWADDNDGSGANNLGKCLMDVRVAIGGNEYNKKCLKKLSELYEFIDNMD
jgi:ribA/ribD-fused uncharacterized protein